MDKLKTIIVDDKYLFREELKILLNDYPQIEVVGEAGDVNKAVQLVKMKTPDVIFLDIQLTNETGFDLLDRAEVNSEIIFITAYDQYAIRAFEVNALDYLLKPINKDRLSKAIHRLLPVNNELPAITPNKKMNYDDVVYIMVNDSLKFIKINLLKCVIAERNYSYVIYEGCKKELVVKTLHEWEALLPEKYFIRIHRSTIVNFEHVEKVKKCKNYTHEVYIRGLNDPFIISRRYAAKLRDNLIW